MKDKEKEVAEMPSRQSWFDAMRAEKKRLHRQNRVVAAMVERRNKKKP
jgi:hypothetical protein